MIYTEKQPRDLYFDYWVSAFIQLNFQSLGTRGKVVINEIRSYNKDSSFITSEGKKTLFFVIDYFSSSRIRVVFAKCALCSLCDCKNPSEYCVSIVCRSILNSHCISFCDVCNITVIAENMYCTHNVRFFPW